MLELIDVQRVFQEEGLSESEMVTFFVSRIAIYCNS